MKKVLLLVFVFLMYNLGAQHEVDMTSNSHDFKNFRVSANLGHCYIPHAKSGEDNSNLVILIPTYGLDFQYWFNHKWAIGLKSDIEIATYSVEKNSDTYFEREIPVILAAVAMYSPWDNGLTFMLGTGFETDVHDNFHVYRLGLGYEIHLKNNWDIAPEFIYDLKDSHINAFTFAIAIGKRF